MTTVEATDGLADFSERVRPSNNASESNETGVGTGQDGNGTRSARDGYSARAYLPVKPIPYNGFRSDLCRMGFPIQFHLRLGPYRLGFSDGHSIVLAGPSEVGGTTFFRPSDERGEGMLEVIGDYYGTDLVGEDDETYFGLLRTRYREGLEGLGIEDLVDEAGELLDEFHSSFMRRNHPLTPSAEADDEAVQEAAEHFMVLLNVLGERLVDDHPYGLDDDDLMRLRYGVGCNTVYGFYARESDLQERERECLMAGDWATLRRTGWITEEEYTTLVSRG
jgi:hypothetical protein